MIRRFENYNATLYIKYLNVNQITCLTMFVYLSIMSSFKHGRELNTMKNEVSNVNACALVRVLDFIKLSERFCSYLDVSSSSLKTYKSGVKKFLTFISDNGITQPTRDTVLAYKKDLMQKHTASATALYMSSVRRFFRWLDSEGLYKDITNGIKSPTVDKGHKRDFFTASQVKNIISDIDRKTLKGKRDYALFCLLSATGLRTIETQRASIEDIRTVGGEPVLFVQGKGRSSKSEFVKLSDPVLKAITEYLSARGAVADDEPLFASLSHRNFGGRMTTRSISRIAKSAMKHAGYNSKRLTAHSLRHSAVTLALLAGMDIRQVSAFARHSSINVTMIYAHDVERLKSQVENAISKAIFD